jgi:GH35 family endo-1,4-beta-xylanase
MADPLLASAPDRIRKHRAGTLEVTVVDADGKPVPDADVHVEQSRHEFLFGCNIFAFGRLGTDEQSELYQTRFAGLLNFATLPFYWAGYERRQGQPDHQRLEPVIEWCRAQGITTKGHPLVWNHDAGSPHWLPDDPATMRKLSDARVTDCVTRFRGKIGIFDVVNEAAEPYRNCTKTKLTELVRKIGIEDFTRRPFELARKANPDATLLINDYNTGPDFEKVIRSLEIDGKRLYDTIGIQSHMHGGPWAHSRTWSVCERFAKFGVPLHFTETTLVSGPKKGGKWQPTTPEMERSQAKGVAEFYTILFSHPAVEAITWWDLSDARAWQGAAAGLVRRDQSPKPAYHAIYELIRKKWWTRCSGKTDSRGRFTTRAFFGKHRVSCTHLDGSQPAAEITLSRSSGRASCRLERQLP